MDSQTKSSKAADTVAALKGIPTREALLESLSNELVEVTFDKLNGDERTMMCTLSKTYLPEATKEDPLSQTKIRNLEEKTIVVWDITAQAWRSFRYDRVKKVVQITPLSG
jgi:WYL_2, Sm-like SH3 beta-barrel fold